MSEEYTAISGNTLIENTKTEFDMFLRVDTSGQSKYVLFCRGNEDLSQERKEELLSKNIDNLYISSKDTDKYLKYQEKNLENIINDENKSSREKSSVVYQVAKNLLTNLLLFSSFFWCLASCLCFSYSPNVSPHNSANPIPIGAIVAGSGTAAGADVRSKRVPCSSRANAL